MTQKELDNRITNLENMVARLLEIVSGGGYSVAVQPCAYTLHKWLDEWLATFKAPNVKPNTYESLDVAVRVHIKPNLPDIPLNLIQGLELQKFLMDIKMSRTRKIVYDVLKSSFTDAQGLKLIADNPMKAVKIPAHVRKRGSHLDTTELAAFKTAIRGHTLEKLFLFLLYTGCRRNEALSLNSADVDTKNKLLHIRGTKTELSDRTIPLFDNVAALLVDIKPNNDGFYFQFRPDYPTHAFKKLCPAHKLHDLRHTFATQCLEAKIPLKVVQTWLGHSEIDTTANIYSHVSKELNLAEAEAFNSYIKEKTL